MTRFPYHFDRGGPSTSDGTPVIFSRTLQFTTAGTGFTDEHFAPGHTLLIIDQGNREGRVAYTNDPDHEWNYYLGECIEQARRIVRDGLRVRLPWLRDQAA